jgi:hypothetical protein
MENPMPCGASEDFRRQRAAIGAWLQEHGMPGDSGPTR